MVIIFVHDPLYYPPKKIIDGQRSLLKFFGENFIVNVSMVTISLSINPYRDLELADY